jgi:PGF-CTERM protein
MSEWTLNRRETLKGIGVATLGLAGASTARGQETNDIVVTIDPQQVVLAPGETATVDIVVQDANRGVAAFTDIRLDLDSSVASIESFSLTRGTPVDNSRIRNDGQTLVLAAALLDNTHPSAPEIAIAEATIRANSSGQTTVAVNGGSLSGNDDTAYTSRSESGSVVVESETAPAAALAWSPSPAEATETVTFDAGESTGAIVEYRWDFDGDGTVDTTTQLPTVDHTYSESGERTVAVEVEDTSGRTARTEETITVEEFTPELNARLDLSTDRPEVGEQIGLDASESTGPITEYRWDFVGNGNFQETTTEPTTTHTYEEAGERAVILQIADGEGETDETLMPLTVQSPEEALSAAFDWLPEQPAVGDTVGFDASASTGDIVEYRWDFGAGGEGFFDERTGNPATTHTYEEPGEKTVILQVEDSAGQMARAEESVVIEQSGGGLSAAFDWTPAEPDVGEQISFDASGSTGDIVEYRWDLNGDGTVDVTTTSPTTTRSYDASGPQSVVLEIEDTSGQTDLAVGQIAVGGDESDGTDLSATVELQSDQPMTGEEVTFDASASTGDIAEYRWDFDGDGTTDATTTAPTESYTYDESGAKTVILQIADGDGQTAQTALPIAVTGGSEALSVSLDWRPTAPAVNAQVSFDVSGSTGDIVEYRWDFDGDGTVDATTSDPATTHRYETAGERTVVLEAVTSDGQTARTEETVVVDAPAEDLSAAFDWTPAEPETGQEVSFDASGSTGPIAEYRWDVDGDNTVETATANPAATYTYDVAGTRLVKLTVSDGDGRTASAEQMVDVQDDSDSTNGDNPDDGSGDGNDGDGDGSGGDGGGGNGNESDGDGSSGNGNESDGNGSSGDGDGSSNDSNDDGDGSGPGFGVGSALAGLGGAGYLLKRRILSDSEQE